MTMVSNDPAWWPTINANRTFSYFIVAACVVMTYDWALTFGREVELIWRQRWSPMTVLYLTVRYLGILFAVMNMLASVSTILLSDTVSLILSMVWSWTPFAAFAMVQVIIITRLHAMYQRSRKILIFLIVTSLAVNIFNGIVTVLMTMHTSGEELILSGTYLCSLSYNPEDVTFLYAITWIFFIAWEVVALCLAVWIALKHFLELRQHSAGGIIGNCFAVLIKSHMVHFTSFIAVCCYMLILNFTPILSMVNFLDSYIISGVFQILQVVQTFVLGPHLILGVREYHAKLVADADTATVMTSIAFQERLHISTGRGV
ncbi:hypothetical protein BDR06DRAFT_117437 [Suillus hirtellus]|nr:hypothetical protein BDR06DRAFT_117437 [Suillus hirtellus]